MLEDARSSFRAYSKFHVGDRWRVRDVTNAGLQIMWSWHPALPPSGEKENGIWALCSQCGLHGSGVAFLTRPAPSPRPLRRWTVAAAALRMEELLIACVGLLNHLFFLMFCWSQRGCAERFRSRLNILCDLVFKPTPSEEDLTVTRSWVLMSSIILFISYAACKWNHWQVLFINDEAITRKMGAHTEGHNRFQ